MRLIIDPKIFEQNHDLKIGAIILRGINNTKRVSAVESLLRGACAQRTREFANKDLYEHPMIQAWSQAYGKFGVNPHKHPPSIAALLKRIVAGKDIPHINLLVDIYNYFSLKFMLPIGGEDLDWLCGDLRLTFTKGGEPFRPIASIEVEKAEEGEAAYMDNGGITCRYWNYRECERTKFTPKTVNAVILIEDLSKMHMDNFGAMLKEIQNTLSKYIGGQIEPYILNEENKSIDLGVEGRKHCDDSKVPQQEIAHFMEVQKEKRLKMEQKNAAADKFSEGLKSLHPVGILDKPKVENQETQPEEPKKKLVTKAPVKELAVEDQNLVKNKIKKLIKQALKKGFPEIKNSEIAIEYPTSENFGDYASNVAMHLGKTLKLNPREIAQKIVENFPKSELIEKTEIAGPGFINFFISEKFINKEITKVLKEKKQYGKTEVGEKKNLIVEYSQPNIAKPLGVHHLLSTIIGQSLNNIYQRLGFKTIGINYIGDWGTQFGKLIYAYKNWGTKEVVEADPINELLKLYVRFHDEAEKKPELEDAGRLEFKKFEDGNEENRQLWQWFVDESLKEIQKTYDKLGGIKFDLTQGESFFEDKMPAVLEDGKKQGVFEIGEEGAYVIKFDDPNIPTVPVQKKDGATLYITRDFASLKYRLEKWKPEKILYVVDVAQSTHFKQLFAAAEKLGWYQGEAEHVWFGRMQFRDGQMSTRKGNIILLNEVLDEAVKRAEVIIENKNPNLKNKANVARIVGIGAVKYNILSQNRTSDIVFDWDKMLSLDGNSAPYLQYSYARARSILRKNTGKKTIKQMTIDESIAVVENGGNDEVINENKTDEAKIEKITKALTHLFPKFPEYLAFAAREYRPNILSNYLYLLAQRFNGFYNSVPVLRTDDLKQKKERLKIVEATAQILRNGLEILGVEVTEEM